MPVHHLLEQILNKYIETAGLQSGQPLFQSVNSAGMEVTGRALNRYNAWAAIRKRAKAAGFLTPVGCHTWRATGVALYLNRRLWPFTALNSWTGGLSIGSNFVETLYLNRRQAPILWNLVSARG